MNFEKLPDEILLETCQYLSSADVLYSLFNLNSRLNRTILRYRQHVVLRRIDFLQFEKLCFNVLPIIGSTIRSLCINANWTDLLAKRFHFYFGDKMNKVFPNLEHLMLVAFSGDELNYYIESIHDLPYLNKLTIHDRYNVTDAYKQTLFHKIFSANQFRLATIIFNRHSESLSINKSNSTIYPKITELSIHLEDMNDLYLLLKSIPNIRRLSVVINNNSNEEKLSFDQIIMNNLVEFHLESFRRPWIFDELHSLIQQMPYVKSLSFDLFSQDSHLVDGQRVFSLVQYNNITRFDYAIGYTSNYPIQSIDDIILSWSSTPYSVCCLGENNKRNMFLHTIPYGFPYLDINSSFVKYMNKPLIDYSSHVKELLLFHVSTFTETFAALRKCQKVKDLAFEIEERSSGNNTQENSSATISLPTLNRLNWLSVDGCPSDSTYIQYILSSAPNLCMIIIHMQYFINLIATNDNQSCLALLKHRMRHLSIKLSDQHDLNEKNVKNLSNIFTNVRYIIVESNKSVTIPVEDIILLFLDKFQNHNLSSIIARGLTSERLQANPYQWLIDNTYLSKHINKFQAECDENECRIWL